MLAIGGLKSIAAGSAFSSQTLTAQKFLTTIVGIDVGVIYGAVGSWGIGTNTNGSLLLRASNGSEQWRVDGGLGNLYSSQSRSVDANGGNGYFSSVGYSSATIGSCGINFNPNAITITGTGGVALVGGDSSTTRTCGSGLTAASLPGVLNVNVTPVASSGAASNLISYAMPANTLTTTGRGIRVTAWGHTTNNANAKTVSLAFGSQTIITKQLAVSLANGLWKLMATIVRTGASTQEIFAEGWNDDAIAVSGTDGPTILYAALRTAGTQTETASITIKGVATTATTTDITQDGMIVEFI